jgi:hypothetical protein
MGKSTQSSYLAFILCIVITVVLHKNSLLKHVIEGKIEGRIKVKERRGRRRKQLLDDLRKKREDTGN